MKLKQVLLTGTIVTGLMFSQAALAQSVEQSTTPSVEMSDPYTNFQAKLSEAEKAAAANDLKSMHKYAEAIAEALKALQNTEMAKDTLIANTLTKAIPVAESLDATGDSGDMPGTLAVLKKLQGVNALIKARMPAASSSDGASGQALKTNNEKPPKSDQGVK